MFVLLLTTCLNFLFVNYGLGYYQPVDFEKLFQTVSIRNRSIDNCDFSNGCDSMMITSQSELDDNLDDFVECECVAERLCDPDPFDSVILLKKWKKSGRRCSNKYETCCRRKKIPAANTFDRSACGSANKPYFDFVKPRNAISEEIEVGEFPWMVAIVAKKTFSSYNYVYKCGGSLVHPQLVLTAAHCLHKLKKNQIKVLAGISQLYKYQETIQERDVSQIIEHKSYFVKGLFNDIALIVLDKPFRLNDAVDIVCLPPSTFALKKTNCISTGWGSFAKGWKNAKNCLKKVPLNLVSRKKCERNLRQRLGKEFQLHASFVCAIGSSGQDTCEGDGGSPLICSEENSSKWFQVGIVSWGVTCGRKQLPGVYTSTLHFSGWIQRNIDALQFDDTIS